MASWGCQEQTLDKEAWLEGEARPWERVYEHGEGTQHVAYFIIK